MTNLAMATMLLILKVMAIAIVIQILAIAVTRILTTRAIQSLMRMTNRTTRRMIARCQSMRCSR